MVIFKFLNSDNSWIYRCILYASFIMSYWEDYVVYLCMYTSYLVQSDLDRSGNSRSRLNLKSTDIENKQMHRPVASDQRPVLRKSLSQKDLRSYDGYSVSVINVWILSWSELYAFISNLHLKDFIINTSAEILCLSEHWEKHYCFLYFDKSENKPLNFIINSTMMLKTFVVKL